MHSGIPWGVEIGGRDLEAKGWGSEAVEDSDACMVVESIGARMVGVGSSACMVVEDTGANMGEGDSGANMGEGDSGACMGEGDSGANMREGDSGANMGESSGAHGVMDRLQLLSESTGSVSGARGSVGAVPETCVTTLRHVMEGIIAGTTGLGAAWTEVRLSCGRQ